MSDTQENYPDAAAKPAPEGNSNSTLKLVLQDLLDSGTHSRDFNGTRADYITLRIRVIAVTLAVITPLWIPVDFLLLPPGKAASITIMRIAAILLFLLLGLWAKPIHHLPLARIKLVVLICLMSYCNIHSKLILGGEAPDGLLIAYSFLPYLIIAVQAIFPLTLRESLVMIFVAMGLVVGLNIYVYQLLTLNVLAQLWLMGLLGGIAILAQMTQLHMLLGLYRQATHDPLTSLYNRRAFIERMNHEVSRTRRYRHAMTVLMFDLDRFKRINDNYGHLTGDNVLQSFAMLLTRTLRTSDLIGRYGGEEFLVLLPETSAEAGHELAERVRREWETLRIEGLSNEVISITVSGGVAQLRDDESTEDLIRRVDECLYEAKKHGRNQTVLSS